MQDALFSKSSEDVMRPDHTACLQILAQLLVRQQASQYKHCVFREKERDRERYSQGKIRQTQRERIVHIQKKSMWVLVKWKNRILLSRVWQSAESHNGYRLRRTEVTTQRWGIY